LFFLDNCRSTYFNNKKLNLNEIFFSIMYLLINSLIYFQGETFGHDCPKRETPSSYLATVQMFPLATPNSLHSTYSSQFCWPPSCSLHSSPLLQKTVADFHWYLSCTQKDVLRIGPHRSLLHKESASQRMVYCSESSLVSAMLKT
jgi:hypothetical protein